MNIIVKQILIYINERHTCQDDIDNENTQDKKKNLAWSTHGFINKFIAFAKFCKLKFVYCAN